MLERATAVTLGPKTIQSLLSSDGFHLAAPITSAISRNEGFVKLGTGEWIPANVSHGILLERRRDRVSLGTARVRKGDRA